MRQVTVDGAEKERQFAFFIVEPVESAVAVNIEADAGVVMNIFAELPLWLQAHVVMRVLKQLAKDGGTTIFHDDIFSGETIYVERLEGGDEHNVRLRVTH